MPADERDGIVEGALRQVLLWDTVKDRLDREARDLSLEEQQKLCIARLLPVKPAVLLMDEPCSARRQSQEGLGQRESPKYAASGVASVGTTRARSR